MSIIRVFAMVLVLLSVALPIAEHASASWFGGDHAGVNHAPRTPPRSARVTVVTALEALRLAPLPAAGPVPASPDAGHPSRPLAAPFVPPRR